MKQACLHGSPGREESLALATLANRREMAAREAIFLRHGYDSAAAIAFVLGKILPLPGRVLELGTGKGRFVVALAAQVSQVVSVDLDPAEQQHARLYARYAGVDSRIRFETGNAQRLPWPAGAFDAVVTMNALHHFPQPDQALREMVRVLKFHGVLVLCDFSPAGFRLLDEIQAAEGKTHPHPPRRFPHWQAQLRAWGFRTQTWTGYFQEVLVAKGNRASP